MDSDKVSDGERTAEEIICIHITSPLLGAEGLARRCRKSLEFRGSRFEFVPPRDWSNYKTKLFIFIPFFAHITRAKIRFYPEN